jgi:hypothetical protein
MKPAEITVKVVELLTPLTTEERQRVVAAAMTLLGDAPVSAGQDQSIKDGGGDGDADTPELKPRARVWMKQNHLTWEQISQVFHVNGGAVEFIASDVPGKNSKEKTHSTYVVMGIVGLLGTGEPSFADKDARTLCRTLGCFNEGNHSSYLNDIGNELAGSKQQGWSLTQPGMKRAADIVKALAASGQ